jgi:demethylmenaquinone methyltransferase/2-methoxy-6-polyprenyl-1,4-benzoquinol methylase
LDRHPGVEVAHRFFAGTGPTYDLIANLCTFGFDISWKRKILREIPPRPVHIIDQACGTGILTLRIARKFPSCRVTGVELRSEYLNIAKQKAAAMKSKNLEFILGRAEDVVLNGPIDCVASSYLAKYADLGRLVRNAAAMLRQGGVLIMHDFTYPQGQTFPGIWKFYFRILRTVGAGFFPGWQTVFHELPDYLRKSRWVPELLAFLRENGFVHVRFESFTLGTSAMVTATRQRAA